MEVVSQYKYHGHLIDNRLKLNVSIESLVTLSKLPGRNWLRLRRFRYWAVVICCTPLPNACLGWTLYHSALTVTTTLHPIGQSSVAVAVPAQTHSLAHIY